MQRYYYLNIKISKFYENWNCRLNKWRCKLDLENIADTDEFLDDVSQEADFMEGTRKSWVSWIPQFSTGGRFVIFWDKATNEGSLERVLPGVIFGN
jgi:hypothetical protein